MLSADAKSSIDRIWNVFWSNGMTNPLTVVEQITFLIFMKLLDDNQIMQERNANLLKTKLKDPVFKKGVCVISAGAVRFKADAWHHVGVKEFHGKLVDAGVKGVEA